MINFDSGKNAIQHSINVNNYKSYLEVGTSNGQTFLYLKCDRKVGIDPSMNDEVSHLEVYNMISDEFFEINKDSFDIIFIDGDHDSKVVTRDFNNAIRCLNPGGSIFLHDSLPETEEAQLVPCPKHLQSGGIWNGDAWRTVAGLLDTPYTYLTADTQCGLTVVKWPGPETCPITDVIPSDISYDTFKKNQNKYLKLVPANDFMLHL
ncbi:MAG: class I SAM-dependent methyltransferase [Betaproteobacteria bacterium]|jgi:SAM-dependent methyltransferase